MKRYDRTNRDYLLKKRLLPCVQLARSQGCRRLDDLHAIVTAEFTKTWTMSKPPTRSSLYRAMLRLRELGLDPGPDDRATARRLGRPTRGKKASAEKVIGDLHHQDVQDQPLTSDAPEASPVDGMNAAPE